MQSLKALLDARGRRRPTPRQDVGRRARSEGAQPPGDHPHAADPRTPRASTPSTTPSSTTASPTSTGAASHPSTATSRPSPSIDDFVLWMFRKAIDGFKSDRPGGLQNIQLDFASFRNDRRSQDALVDAREARVRDLDYKASIEDASFRDLVAVDLFEETDRKIISDLARAVTEQTVTAREVAEVVRARQSSVWIDGYRQLYTAIGAAAELLSELSTIDFTFSSFDEALERYRTDWFRIDQLYRQFTYARRTYEGPHPLDAAARAGREALHQQVRLRAGQRLAEAGRRGRASGRSTALRSQTLVLRRLRRAARPRRQEGRRHHLRRAALRGRRRARLAHPSGGPLRRRPRGRPRRAAELHPTRHGGAASAPHPQALGRRQDRARRRPADQRHRVPQRRSWRASAGRRSRPRTSRHSAPRSVASSSRTTGSCTSTTTSSTRPATSRAPSASVFEAAEEALRELVDLVKKAGERQRHQHLRHRRPRLPVPGRGAARAVLPLRDSRRATTSWSTTGATSSATA